MNQINPSTYITSVVGQPKPSESTNMERSIELLKACVLLLQKQEDSGYLLNLLSETIFYDDCECDGYCLLEDIKAELKLLESEDSND